MASRYFNRGLLLITLIALALGFLREEIWALGALMGLFPALWWVVNDFRNKLIGSDFLAVLSLLATLLTHEYFAGALSSLMLASGRVLENWAEGQAERQLKSLLARIPQRARRFTASAVIEDIEVSERKVSDHLLVRAGEITPGDGQLLGSSTLD